MSAREMLDRKLFVGLSRLVGPREALAAHLRTHLDFMIGLEEAGTLFASGPFVAGGENTGEGLTIVRAASKEEAAAILARDPFVVAGVRRFDVHEWRVMEGAIHVTLHASKQRGALP